MASIAPGFTPRSGSMRCRSSARHCTSDHPDIRSKCVPKALSENETEAFRERICESAARLYVEEGPAAVTMRRIATELGCGTMTPYRYYPSKESIMTAVRTR